jgi:biopolymer transport protein ExbB
MQLEQMIPSWFMQLGVMAWPLFICSLLAMAIMLERLLFTYKITLRKNIIYQQLHDSLIQNKQQPKSLRDEIVENKLQELQPSYFMGVNFLRMIGSISPMLGLTGTILGIISAFKVIAVQTGPVTPNLIADGLWEAMLTTAVGLLIAVPALLMAYFFKYFAQRRLDDLCYRLNKVSTAIELEKYADSNVQVVSSLENIAA